MTEKKKRETEGSVVVPRRTGRRNVAEKDRNRGRLDLPVDGATRDHTMVSTHQGGGKQRFRRRRGRPLVLKKTAVRCNVVGTLGRQPGLR